MSQLSKKLRNTTANGLMFWCPGCDDAHKVQHGEGAGPRWGWNGNVDKPTFTPSVLVSGTAKLTQTQYENWLKNKVLPDPVPSVCHSFVTDGKIQFLGDCTHALAGKTVDLADWDSK